MQGYGKTVPELREAKSELGYEIDISRLDGEQKRELEMQCVERILDSEPARPVINLVPEFEPGNSARIRDLPGYAGD
ncbi:MAG: hypothetical protein ABEJ64_01525 [Candidatus Nanohaloarchaea archaeon]